MVKVSFESVKIIMKKIMCFWKWNITIKVFLYSIFLLLLMNLDRCLGAYIFYSYDMCHARLGHVNSSYVIKLQRLGLTKIHE